MTCQNCHSEGCRPVILRNWFYKHRYIGSGCFLELRLAIKMYIEALHTEIITKIKSNEEIFHESMSESTLWDAWPEY